MCGDIDVPVLVIVQDTTNVLHRIISKLKSGGTDFLIDDLSVNKNKKSTTYLGLCKQAGEKSEVRRLGGNTFGCAIVHYSGSALFSRGIIGLTEYYFKSNGQILPTPTEESVFEHF